MNLLRVVRSGGVLFLAVPDKQYTFDLTRPCTAWSTLRETHRTDRRADRSRLYEEWAAHVQHKTGAEAHASARELERQRYSIHFNVWTLAGLFDFFHRAQMEEALPFSIGAMVSSENEAIAVLHKKPRHG